MTQKTFTLLDPAGETFVYPATDSTLTDKASGYQTIAQQLHKFGAIGELSAPISNRLSYLSCEDLVEKLVANKAKFHKKCRSK